MARRSSVSTRSTGPVDGLLYKHFSEVWAHARLSVGCLLVPLDAFMSIPFSLYTFTYTYSVYICTMHTYVPTLSRYLKRCAVAFLVQTARQQLTMGGFGKAEPLALLLKWLF